MSKIKLSNCRKEKISPLYYGCRTVDSESLNCSVFNDLHSPFDPLISHDMKCTRIRLVTLTHRPALANSFNYVEISFETWSLTCRERKSVNKIFSFRLTASLIHGQIFFQHTKSDTLNEGIQSSCLSSYHLFSIGLKQFFWGERFFLVSVTQIPTLCFAETEVCNRVTIPFPQRNATMATVNSCRPVAVEVGGKIHYHVT